MYFAEGDARLLRHQERILPAKQTVNFQEPIHVETPVVGFLKSSGRQGHSIDLVDVKEAKPKVSLIAEVIGGSTAIRADKTAFIAIVITGLRLVAF